MPRKDFSIRESIQFGWDSFKANFIFFVSLLILVWLACFILGLICSVFKENPAVAVLSGSIALALQIYIGLGLTRIGLKICDRQNPRFSNLFSDPSTFFQYAAATLIYFLAVGAGLVLLAIPGIIAAILFMFYGYLIVDRGQNAVDSLKKSVEITRGKRLKLFYFSLLLIAINILGALFFVVGLLVSMPVTLVANAQVYRRLIE